jgi:hypothetical protein
VTLKNLSNLDDFAECDSDNQPQWDVLIVELKGLFQELDRQNAELRARIEYLENER